MGFQTNGPIADLVKEGAAEKPERFHAIQVATTHGVGIVKVPHTNMKCCGACGSERFLPQFYVGFGKPNNQIGGELMQIMTQVFVCVKCGEELTQIMTQVFVCVKCGEELTPASPQIGDKKIVEGS